MNTILLGDLFSEEAISYMIIFSTILGLGLLVIVYRVSFLIMKRIGLSRKKSIIYSILILLLIGIINSWWSISNMPA